MQDITKLKDWINDFNKVEKVVNDINILLQLFNEENDISLENEINNEIVYSEKLLKALE